MTPSARVAAAIDCLDRHFAGEPVEKVLTTWARQNRFAGSKDRRALRDLVFDAIRNLRSYGYVGGGETGRRVMLGAGHLADALDEMFDGAGYGAAPVSDEERAALRDLSAASLPVQLDVQDWVWAMAEAEGIDGAADIFRMFKERAELFLRVNTLRGSLEDAQRALSRADIVVEPHALAAHALRVVENAPRVAQSDAFRSGLVEVQDAASQATVDHIAALLPDARVLDFCAGGGGKALAMAVYGPSRLDAYDASPARMRDLPERARRAGARITCLETPKDAYDVVFCDCPCSGSGAWRRQADAKWALSEATLADLGDRQDLILDRAAGHVAEGGHLVYATCSIFPRENMQRVESFLERTPAWQMASARQISPLEGADGFFVAVLRRAD